MRELLFKCETNLTPVDDGDIVATMLNDWIDDNKPFGDLSTNVSISGSVLFLTVKGEFKTDDKSIRKLEKTILDGIDTLNGWQVGIRGKYGLLEICEPYDVVLED